MLWVMKNILFLNFNSLWMKDSRGKKYLNCPMFMLELFEFFERNNFSSDNGLIRQLK